MKILETFSSKIEFSVGLVSSEATGYQAIDKADAVKTISEILEGYGVLGFSVVDVLGYWKGNPEASLLVTVYTTSTDNAGTSSAAADMAEALNQECVLYSVTKLGEDASCVAGLAAA